MILYVDLDETLVANLFDGRIIPRPGAKGFLSDLSRHGDLVLLTASARSHASEALGTLGPAARLFRSIVTREDLAPIAAQIEVIETADVPEAGKAELYESVPPILPPGYVFDDFGVGSWVYALKGLATGTPPERWIGVDQFTYKHPDRGGLRKAYREFRKREATYQATLSGRKPRSRSA